MQSAIGQHFKTLKAQRFAFGLGIAAVALDFFCVIQRIGYDTRLALSLTLFAIFVFLTDGNLNSIGLRLTPKQGWKPWVRMSVVIGLIVLLCIVLGLGICFLAGYEIPKPMISPMQLLPSFIFMCFVAPVMEETIYRVIVCVSLVSVLGYWKTIATSGFLFAVLHMLYGNPSQENLVGGFFIAWAYLKSETILIPIMLHSVGNSFAMMSQLAAWYLLAG